MIVYRRRTLYGPRLLRSIPIPLPSLGTSIRANRSTKKEPQAQLFFCLERCPDWLRTSRRMHRHRLHADSDDQIVFCVGKRCCPGCRTGERTRGS